MSQPVTHGISIIVPTQQEIPPEYTKCIFINIDQEFFGEEKTGMLMRDLKFCIDGIFEKYKHWDSLKIGVVMDVIVPK